MWSAARSVPAAGSGLLWMTGEDIESSETPLIHPASRDRGRQADAGAEVFREARKPSVFLQRVVWNAKALLKHLGTLGGVLRLLRKFRVVIFVSSF